MSVEYANDKTIVSSALVGVRRLNESKDFTKV